MHRNQKHESPQLADRAPTPKNLLPQHLGPHLAPAPALLLQHPRGRLLPRRARGRRQVEPRPRRRARRRGRAARSKTHSSRRFLVRREPRPGGLPATKHPRHRQAFGGVPGLPAGRPRHQGRDQGRDEVLQARAWLRRACWCHRYAVARIALLWVELLALRATSPGPSAVSDICAPGTPAKEGLHHRGGARQAGPRGVAHGQRPCPPARALPRCQGRPERYKSAWKTNSGRWALRFPAPWCQWRRDPVAAHPRPDPWI